jgi:hypothetical protein
MSVCLHITPMSSTPTVPTRKMQTAHGNLSTENIARLVVIASCRHNDADDIELREQMCARFPCIGNDVVGNEWKRHRKGILDTAGRTLCELHPLRATDFLLQVDAVDTADAFLEWWCRRHANPDTLATETGDIAFAYTYIDHSKLVRKLLGMERILHAAPSSYPHIDRGELASLLNATKCGRVRCKRVVALYREQLFVEGTRSLPPPPHMDTASNLPTFVGHAIV